MGPHELWIFNCPLHGPEHQVLCFRAFDEANVDRWAKYLVTYALIETTRAERERCRQKVMGDGP